VADEVKPMDMDKDYIIGLLIVVVFGIIGLALLCISHAHAADTWVQCKPGTLIRTEPEPRCVGEFEGDLESWQVTAPPDNSSFDEEPSIGVAHPECPPCPMLDDDPTEHARPCPPCSVHSDEDLAKEWEEKYLGAKSERDGFAALHQREAADNRRCKRNLKKCRRRK